MPRWMSFCFNLMVCFFSLVFFSPVLWRRCRYSDKVTANANEGKTYSERKKKNTQPKWLEIWLRISAADDKGNDIKCDECACDAL